VSDAAATPRVVVFGPSPLLGVEIEHRGAEAGDELHLHAGGQGVWAARMAAELGGDPVLFGLLGGETGVVLSEVLARMPFELRLVETVGASGAYVLDRRSGETRMVAQAWAPAPTRHEVDDLVSRTTAAALGAGAMLVGGPVPSDALPLAVYGTIVTDVRASGTPVLVDLAPPRLESALTGEPDVVKLNDWELAQFANGAVDEPEQLLAAARALLARGARAVIVTRGGEPAIALRGEEVWRLVPPRLQRGMREGCGDAMLGALGAAYARGLGWEESLRLGAAAGAANFLRHGLGSAEAGVVHELRERVTLERLE